MQKKGQVTVFVVIGIVIVILAVLIWYLKDSGSSFLPSIFLGFSAKKDVIEKNLNDCVQKAVRPTLTLAALQGGDINTKSYRMYKGNKVSYLCVNIPGKKQCLNVMLPIFTLQNRMQNIIFQQINNCVDRSLLDGVETKGSKELKVNMKIRRENVVVDVNYDVTLLNKNLEVPLGVVRVNVDNLPFEELYEVSNLIVNSEATIGDFEQLFFMLSKKGKYEIQVDRPYPDKIYIMNKKDSLFKYQFAIQGENTIGKII